MTQLETPVQTPKLSRERKALERERKRAREASVSNVEESESDEPTVETENEPKWKRNAQFLSQYLLRRDDPRAATHSSMMLGRYCIPPERREEFYRKYYAEVLSAKVPSLFLTERYNEEDFRFFVDIDYEFEEQNVPKHTYTIAKIQQIFADLYDTYTAANDFSPLSISSIELFPCRAASRTDWKLHVIFYKTIVDWQSILKIGGHVQNRLLTDDRIKLDMKVYTKGSLRMLGSYKAFDTTSTHPNETESVYTPIDIHTGEPLEWTEKTLEEYSIFLTPRQKECLEESRRERALVTKELGIDFGTNPTMKATTGPTQYTGSGLVSTGSPLYQCIKDNFGKIIASAAGRIIHNSETNHSTVDCSKTTYCPLAGKYHKGNHTYIVLSEFGMRIKCHSVNHEPCIKGGELIPRAALPEEVHLELPTGSENSVATADISTIRGQAEVLHPDFISDDLLTDQDSQNLLILSLSGTHRDVANLVKPALSDEFVCVDADAQRWYHYRQPLWRYPEAKNDVKVVIGELPHAYTQYIQTYYQKFTGETKIRATRIDTITRVKNKVSDNQFKDRVARELATMSLDVRFEQMLDENRTLIGFNNGVFDIEKREFRAGKSSDLVSMTTGYDFPTQSNPVYRAALEKLIEDMQPEEANRKYLKKNCASCLAPGNTFELFHIWCGTTRNGKSVLALLLSIVLGSTGYKKENGELSKYPYACPFEPAFLTCDRSNSSSAPAPEIVAARLARVLIGSEPERGHKINSAFVKKLTGNDAISARLLFSNEYVSFNPRFQLILICNDIPEMDHNEQAVWKRSRVVDFPVTFVDNPRLPNERQIDELLKDKLIEDMNWRKEFMLMLIEWYYDLYLVEGMRNPPASVLKATRLYQEKSVLIGEYWRLCITPVDLEHHKHICLDCILQDFRGRESAAGDAQEAYKYTQSKLKADLTDTLGVKVNDKQTRCSNCHKKKQAVKNVRFSDARLAEKEEENMMGVSVEAGVESCM